MVSQSENMMMSLVLELFLRSVMAYSTFSLFALRMIFMIFLESMIIQLPQGKMTARKLLAKCQKQPWQQPCNLIVSHEETFRQFVSPSHEQTAGLKWPCLFSWKIKVSKAQNSFGQNTFKCFLFVCFYFMSVHIPRLYLNIIKKYIFLKHHQWDKVRLT